MQGNGENNVFSRKPGAGVDSVAREAANTTVERSICSSDLRGYVPHLKPDLFPQKVMLEKVIPRSATELAQLRSFVYNKDVDTEKDSNSELGLEKRLDSILIYSCIHAKRTISTRNTEKLIHFVHKLYQMLNVLKVQKNIKTKD